MKTIKTILLAAIVLFGFEAFAQQNEIMILAHRGGMGEGMENTEGSFKRSLEAGIKAYEMDVRITKDGKIVLQHDHTLKRTSGVNRAVEDMTEKELREVTLTDGSKLMFLDEFLDLMTKHEGLYIEFEMKTTKYSDELLYGSGYLDKVAKAVLKAEPKGSTYCMTSFDTRALRYIKEKYPTAKLTYLTKEACDEKSLAIAEALGVKRIACRLEKTSYNGMKLAHKKGFIVNLWPGKNVESFVRAWALGADIHCTDFPIAAKKFAAEQTSWLKVKY